MRPCSVVRAVGVLDGGAPLSWNVCGGQLLDIVPGRDRAGTDQVAVSATLGVA